jgi:hypothetical protein
VSWKFSLQAGSVPSVMLTIKAGSNQADGSGFVLPSQHNWVEGGHPESKNIPAQIMHP